MASRLPEWEPNALLHLFSRSKSLVEYGRQHCRIWSPQTSTLVADLFAGYHVDGLTMPYTMEEFIRQADKRAIQRSTIEERLEGLTPGQVIDRLPPEHRLAGLTPEQRLAGLTPEQREELRKLLENLPSV